MARKHIGRSRLLARGLRGPILLMVATMMAAPTNTEARGLKTPGENEMIVLDMKAALAGQDEQGTRWAYDAAKAIGALQGIVNRERPRLYVVYFENRMAAETGTVLQQPNLDRYWLEWMTAEGRAMEGCRLIRTDNLWDVIGAFSEEVAGMVVWDEDAPATANVASTVAGAMDLLPVRHATHEHSFTAELKARFPHLKPGLDLHGIFTGKGKIPDTNIPSSGSVKCDPYLWAIEKLVRTGKCSPRYIAVYCDGVPWNRIAPALASPYPDLGNAAVFNADYWIARKAFFFDLDPWFDEAASDDPTQAVGTDARTLTTLLETLNEINRNNEIITCGGFQPWWLKYCDAEWNGRDTTLNSRDAVLTEWQYTDILSAYNAVLDADAYGLVGLANASVFQHYPLRDKYEQPTTPDVKSDCNPKATKLLFAMLDYDAGAWTAQMVQANWNDPRRGEIPLLWGINPILSDRVPMAFDAIFSTRSRNDIIGVDEGLGYINPNLVGEQRMLSDLPSALDLYTSTTRRYLNRFDMTVTTFAITGLQGKLTTEGYRLLAELTPNGVGFQAGNRVVDGRHFGTPFKQQAIDLNKDYNPRRMADTIADLIRDAGPAGFVLMRCILVRPTTICEALDILRREHPDLDFVVPHPLDFFRMVGEKHGEQQPGAR